MLFDTNLVHRLTRRANARVRDTVTFYYTPGQSLYKLDYDRADPSLSDLARRIFVMPGALFPRLDKSEHG